MSFGFPASATATRRLGIAPEALQNAITIALTTLGWRTTVASPGVVSAQVGLSFFSWGEIVEIRFYQDGSVTATSRCAFPLQCFDWGKNQRNINEFFRQLEYATGVQGAWV